jgi:hypothetical protein
MSRESYKTPDAKWPRADWQGGVELEDGRLPEKDEEVDTENDDLESEEDDEEELDEEEGDD